MDSALSYPGLWVPYNTMPDYLECVFPCDDGFEPALKKRRQEHDFAPNKTMNVWPTQEPHKRVLFKSLPDEIKKDGYNDIKDSGTRLKEGESTEHSQTWEDFFQYIEFQDPALTEPVIFTDLVTEQFTFIGALVASPKSKSGCLIKEDGFNDLKDSGTRLKEDDSTEHSPTLEDLFQYMVSQDPALVAEPVIFTDLVAEPVIFTHLVAEPVIFTDLVAEPVIFTDLVAKPVIFTDLVAEPFNFISALVASPKSRSGCLKKEDGSNDINDRGTRLSEGDSTEHSPTWEDFFQYMVSQDPALVAESVIFPDPVIEPLNFTGAPVPSPKSRHGRRSQGQSTLVVRGNNVRYSCNVCTKTFSTNQGLKIHQHVHKTHKLISSANTTEIPPRYQALTENH